MYAFVLKVDIDLIKSSVCIHGLSHEHASHSASLYLADMVVVGWVTHVRLGLGLSGVDVTR